MTIRLVEAISLIKLAETFQDNKLPIRVAFKLNKLMTAIETNFKFYTNKMNEIINEYGAVDDEGKPLFTEDGQGRLIKEDYRNECQKQVQELNDLIVEIQDDIKFTFEELETIQISIQDMSLFAQFIEE